jgi:hypothetical protein
MKLQLTALAAALILSVNVAAGEKPATADKAGTKPTQSTTTTSDRYVHGDTVRETAMRDATGKPISPPGEDVSQVARTQGDFMRLDTDKDGVLSADELGADADLTARLDTLDTDGDGVISRTEFNNSLASTDDDELDDDLLDEDD